MMGNFGEHWKTHVVQIGSQVDGSTSQELLPSVHWLLSIMNPTKFQVCEYLINKHEAKGDKIIVFSDSVSALKAYALKLGDTSIDLPEATGLIQISSHFGSRRQEAQRLGRILRAKRRNDPDFKVFFYSLVSKDTDDMFYSSKRQQFLVDQGYTFNIITDIPEINNNENRVYKSRSQQKELLVSVLLSSDKEANSEDEGKDSEEVGVYSTLLKTSTGIEGMAYMETNQKKNISKNKRTKK